MATMQRHLVHVGFPRTGSTSLRGWFDSRSELVYAHDAIGGVTSADGLAWRATVPDEAARWVVTSAERLILPVVEGPAPPPPRQPASGGRPQGHRPAVAEAPTETVAVRRQRACERLRTMFGDPTILIVTRGFRGMLASSYSEALRWGSSASVEDLITEYQESPAREGLRGTR